MSAKQIALRALQSVEVFGSPEQKQEARFLLGVIENATEANPPRFARRAAKSKEART